MMYELAKMPKKTSKVDKALALWLKDYWGAYLKHVRFKDFAKDKEEVMQKSKAPLEHCYDNHKFYIHSWCYKLQAIKQGLSYEPPIHRPFFDKEQDRNMYMQLQEIFEKFGSEESIEELMHLFEIQLNEALDQAIGQTCPNFKLLGTSMTLTTRVSKVLCLQNIGYKGYYDQVFEALCINQQDCEQHYFDTAITWINRNKIRNYSGKMSTG